MRGFFNKSGVEMGKIMIDVRDLKEQGVTEEQLVWCQQQLDKLLVKSNEEKIIKYTLRWVHNLSLLRSALKTNKLKSLCLKNDINWLWEGGA